MWLHPSCSGQLAEGFSVLWSPQCHRDGGCRAWTLRTIRGRNRGWDLSEVPYTEEANLPPVASGLHGALLHVKKQRFTFSGTDTDSGCGFVFIIWCASANTSFWRLGGALRICWHRTSLCCLRPGRHTWAKKVWEWAHDCGTHWLPCTTPLEAVSQNKGVVLQTPLKFHPWGSPLGWSAALQDTVYTLNQELICSAVSQQPGYTDLESGGTIHSGPGYHQFITKSLISHIQHDPNSVPHSPSSAPKCAAPVFGSWVSGVFVHSIIWTGNLWIVGVSSLPL